MKKATGLMKTLPPVDIGWLDIRVVKVLHIQFHDDDTYSYITYVDIGERICKIAVLKLVKHYKRLELWNENFIGVCNINPINKCGVTSTTRLLMAAFAGQRELLRPPALAVPGDIVTVPGYPRKLYDPIAALHRFNAPKKPPKRKIFQAVADDLVINVNKIATYKGIPLQVGEKGNIVTNKLSSCAIK